MNNQIFCAGFVVLAILLSIVFFFWNRSFERRGTLLFPAIELFISVLVGLIYSLVFVWISTDWAYLARIAVGAVLGIFVGWVLMMTSGLLQSAWNYLLRK